MNNYLALLCQVTCVVANEVKQSQMFDGKRLLRHFVPRNDVLYKGAILFLIFIVCPGFMSSFANVTNPHGDINLNCNDCHTTESWKTIRADPNFDHDQTAFQLSGIHRSLGCADCHSDLVFSDTGSECTDCHDDVHEDQFANTCDNCHTPSAWLNEAAMYERHLQTRFPLEGVHAGADCQLCHADGVYVNLPIDCQGCHYEQFEAAQNPNHVAAEFPSDCTVCHDITSYNWVPANYSHPEAFPLIEGHSQSSCVECHEVAYIDTAVDCITCHDDDFQQAEDPDHANGNFSEVCSECHTISAWEPAEYDHELARFVLTGAHIDTDCVLCHQDLQYTGIDDDCYSCHKLNYDEAENPAHTEERYEFLCESCHTTDDWKPGEFDHDLSVFQLTGAHIITECIDCHSDQPYVGTPLECVGCHLQDYTEAEEPDHLEPQISQECAECHNTDAWDPSTFDHNATAFPLTGSHIPADCQSCHVDGQFEGTTDECYGCHSQEFEDSENPDHEDGSFSTNCLVCHSTDGWSPADFDHSRTGFELSHGHAGLDCLSCHLRGNYADTPDRCYGCHQADYEKVADPGHVSGDYSEECLDCHSTSRWTPAKYDHNLASFRLTGAHRRVRCFNCHENSHYNNTPSECFNCHRNEYFRVEDPNHVEGGFDQDCAECHSTSAWSPATFDHDLTDYPLTGRHVDVTCSGCHVDGQFAGTPDECYACHQGDYEEVEDPEHNVDTYDFDCTLCHTTEGWEPADFDHDLSQFALTGAHVPLDCSECHIDGAYNDTPDECYGCHQEDYDLADDPNHLDGQFNQDCTQCHSADEWTPSTFDHNDTEYPLDGAHVEVDCADCHIDGRWEDLSSECYDCHQEDFDLADDPSHLDGQFSHECTECHNTDAWSPSTFDHDDTEYPLEGAHREVQCIDCHIDGQYTDLQSECFDCHQDDFDEIQDPDHSGGQYDHDCTICHSLDAWSPAEFDHDQSDFPLEGEHQTTECADCHVDGQYTDTPSECFFCHEDDYNDADDPDHRGAEFPLQCDLCHSANDWDADYDHDRQYFPIDRGEHDGKWDACSDCHPNPDDYSVFTCIDCHEHRRDKMDEEHRGEDDYRYDSEACLECHPDGDEMRRRISPGKKM